MIEMFYYGSLEANPLYNCSAMSERDVNISHSIRRPIWGMISFSYSIVVEVLYALCLPVMSQNHFYQYSCYKIMFFLGIVDMISSFLNNTILDFNFFLKFIAGCFYFGISFCDYPNFLYTVGSGINCGWGISCYLCLILSLDRLLEASEISPRTLKFLFSETGTYIFICIGFVYGFLFGMLTKAPLFSNTVGCLFPDPLIIDDKVQYIDRFLFFNNGCVVVLTLLIYITYSFYMCRKLGSLEIMQNDRCRRYKRQILIQALVLSMMNFGTAMMYCSFLFINVPEEVSRLAMKSYQTASGLPAIIYISMNRAITEAVQLYINKITGKKIWKTNVISITATTNTDLYKL